MRTIDWWVKGEIFPYIRDEAKKLDVWPSDDKTRQVRVGDILWVNQQVHRQVRAIRFYDSFATAVAREDFRKIWPPARSREELYRLWRSIYPERAEKRGVFVFELSRVD